MFPEEVKRTHERQLKTKVTGPCLCLTEQNCRAQADLKAVLGKAGVAACCLMSWALKAGLCKMQSSLLTRLAQGQPVARSARV